MPSHSVITSQCSASDLSSGVNQRSHAIGTHCYSGPQSSHHFCIRISLLRNVSEMLADYIHHQLLRACERCRRENQVGFRFGRIGTFRRPTIPVLRNLCLSITGISGKFFFTFQIYAFRHPKPDSCLCRSFTIFHHKNLCSQRPLFLPITVQIISLRWS